jgi:hypothetical protein
MSWPNLAPAVRSASEVDPGAIWSASLDPSGCEPLLSFFGTRVAFSTGRGPHRRGGGPSFRLAGLAGRGQACGPPQGRVFRVPAGARERSCVTLLGTPAQARVIDWPKADGGIAWRAACYRLRVRERACPNVLSRDEVARLIERAGNLQARALLRTLCQERLVPYDHSGYTERGPRFSLYSVGQARYEFPASSGRRRL